MKYSKSNASSNQSEKTVENDILDNNRHAFEPGFPNSLGLSPEDFLSSCSSSTTFLPNLRSGILSISNSKCVLFLNQLSFKGYLRNFMSR